MAAFVAYGILIASGGLAQLESLLGSALGSNSVSFATIVTPGTLITVALAFALLDVLFVTVGGIITAALYNAATRLTEGLFVGFANR